MSTDQHEQYIDRLQGSRKQMTTMLVAVAVAQDWRPAPGEWSFREIAAHMKTTEAECHQVRLRRLLSEPQPYFAYYLNSDRDFSDLDLIASLEAWAAVRQEIIATVRAWPVDKLAVSGTHDTFGKMTVLDILREMHNHGLDHIQELVTVFSFSPPLARDCQIPACSLDLSIQRERDENFVTLTELEPVFDQYQRRQD